MFASERLIKSDIKASANSNGWFSKILEICLSFHAEKMKLPATFAIELLTSVSEVNHAYFRLLHTGL